MPYLDGPAGHDVIDRPGEGASAPEPVKPLPLFAAHEDDGRRYGHHPVLGGAVRILPHVDPLDIDVGALVGHVMNHREHAATRSEIGIVEDDYSHLLGSECHHGSHLDCWS